MKEQGGQREIDFKLKDKNLIESNLLGRMVCKKRRKGKKINDIFLDLYLHVQKIIISIMYSVNGNLKMYYELF